MSDSTPTEPLNIGRVLARTFTVLGRAGLTLVGLAAIASVGGALIELFVGGQMQAAVVKTPALGLVAWAAQFPVFTLGDTAVAVAALVVLGGGRGRPMFSLLAALGLLPVCLVVDLVENLPDVIRQLVMNGQPEGFEVLVASLVIAAAWNTVWMPAIAVAAEEHHGPIATLRRSLELVRGNWFRVFSFTLFMHTTTLILPQVLVAVLMLLTKADAPLWAVAVLSTPFMAFASASQATLYWELARLRDGVNPREVGTIFD